MARPSWFRFFGRESYPLLDRMVEALQASGLGDQHVGARFARLFGLAAAPQPESGIRTGPPQSSPLVVSDQPGSAVPAADPAAGQLATDQATLPSPADAATASGTDPDSLSVLAGGPGAVAMVGGALGTGSVGAGSQLFGAVDAASHYVILYGEDLGGGLVVDRTTNSLLPGGPGDWPEIGQGDDDLLVLSGDYSAGVALPSAPEGIDRVVVSGGDNYNLVAPDNLVAAGRSLEVDAMPLAAGNHILFDGSAETDGRFVFFGGDGGDIFIGGAGNDRIAGLGGADLLAGGGGRDTFAYTGAGESTGRDYDTLGDFDAASDRIDLPGTVAGFAAPVQGGTLSLATFDADLSAALSGLGVSQAAWFAPDAGELAGQIFLVVDANGVAGYQEGEDYVFAVTGAPLADLSGHTDIFV